MNTRSFIADAGPAALASSFRYELVVPTDARRALATGWLGLAIGALLASGLFSILLVLSRAPYVKDAFPLVDFFRVALVVHVDLSVLIWFSAFAGLLWSLHGAPRLLWVGWTALAGATAATVAMCVAPFVDPAAPVMSNYIPVLDGSVFLRSLALFGVSCALLVGRALSAAPRVGPRLR